ncbi:porin family protein [Tenacibaculum sp. 47A_GOM-205m]|uniref:porin family protein n=1 Tax=Tenacibaculum sp. 47A_GOM-205m TaxID=1380384 RepID=UPI00048FCE39|nr:porin family protein [Tenacibaculum sp. 47A_GOM-205m]
MKKLLLVIAMVAAGFSANAQDVKFGVKAGLNLASLNGNKDFTENFDSRTSFHLGAMAEISISDKFSFQPELLYSAQGGSNDDFAGSGADVTFKMDYIAVPLMAKYYVVEGFSLEAGPQLAFRTTSEMKAEANGQESTESLKDETNGFDFGLNFGLGYKLSNGLNFGARYNLGLTDIAKDNEEDAIKNGVFQLSVGYFF